MSSSFDRWEKDPFFSAAEEVQDSADRMESIYRRWMHERKDRPDPTVIGDHEDIDELRRELHTALGTAKWQLEEFDRASRSSDEGFLPNDDTRVRHTQFVSAIGNQISMVESSLKEAELDAGRTRLSWVRLDQGERDELAAFLSGSPPSPDVINMASGEEASPSSSDPCSSDRGGWANSSHCSAGEPASLPVASALRKPPRPLNVDVSPRENSKGERGLGHRRTASAGNDIATWTISLSNEESPRRSLENKQKTSIPKVLSLSGLSGVVESASMMKWPKNGYRKWKLSDQMQDSETIPLQNQQVSQGLHSCYERSKSYISNCDDDSYNKQLYGWLGALQRQLQRSQYQIQYARPLRLAFWLVAALLLIVLFVIRAM